MIDRLPELIDSFSDRQVLVIGDVMLDGYLDGTCHRVCPEVPVPVVEVRSVHVAPGGAANTAANARALGARVTLLGVTGADAEAIELAEVLADAGVSPGSLVRDERRRTLVKRRVTAAGQIVCRLDHGDTVTLSPAAETAASRLLEQAWDEVEAVIVSDYGYGMLTPGFVRILAALQLQRPRLLLADSKRLSMLRAIAPTVVKANYRETLRLLGLESDAGRDRLEKVAEYGSQLLEATGASVGAITLDVAGAMVFERGRPPYRTYADPRPHSRASGAGDTYTAAFALGLAAGGDTPAAAELAAAAAAVVVDKDRTATCTARELRTRVAAESKVTDREGVIVRLAAERRQGRRIVLTGGCFDILHRGHITYLNRAKALGHVLVVGVNTDAGIRRLKGPSRPINALDDRVQVLAALSCVDHIVPFDEDTPHDLIRAVRPDVFVKGGDYTRVRLPEASLVEELGGEVRILPFVPQRSTSSLIERIRSAYGPFARDGSHT